MTTNLAPLAGWDGRLVPNASIELELFVSQTRLFLFYQELPQVNVLSSSPLFLHESLLFSFETRPSLGGDGICNPPGLVRREFILLGPFQLLPHGGELCCHRIMGWSRARLCGSLSY